ncbi:MAG: hypothetical protein JST38_19475 [Bacteroidetes bacterium]|nr:hypothetical protein [Bacteroidota bacterium]
MATVKNYLKGLPKPELEKLVLELCAHNPQVSDRLEQLADTKKAKDIFDRYVNRLGKCFPPLPKGPDLTGIQRVVAEYASIGNDGELAMFLMYTASLGAKYTHDFGDMDEDFYAVFVESFERALVLAKKHGMVEDFRVPADAVAQYADGTGYGFADEIHAIYADFFGHPPPLERRVREGRHIRGASTRH